MGISLLGTQGSGSFCSGTASWNKVECLESRLHEAVTHAVDRGTCTNPYLGLLVHSPRNRHVENEKIHKHGSQNERVAKYQGTRYLRTYDFKIIRMYKTTEYL